MVLGGTGHDSSIKKVSYGGCSINSVNNRDVACRVFPYSYCLTVIGYGGGSNTLKNNVNTVL